MIKRNNLPTNQSKMYVFVQDEVSDYVKKLKMEKLIADHKQGKKIKLGATHTDELTKGDQDGN